MRLLNIHGVGDARLDEYERPAAGPKDVVIRMKACGICGSDLSYIKIGGIPMPGTITALGHEGEGISYDVAAMCEPLAVAMHGVNRAEVRAGDKVVVFGCGPIGLGMILWLVDRGVTDVVALDLAPQRRARALALGARAALDPATVDLRSELAKLHGEVRSYGRVGVGTDAYIDAAGAPNILGDVIMLAKFHSRMVVTAAYMKPVEVPLGRMLTSEMTITTAMGYPTEMPEVVAAMPRLKDRIASMISHKLPFERVIEGLGIAATPQSAKVMIGFGDNRS